MLNTRRNVLVLKSVPHFSKTPAHTFKNISLGGIARPNIIFVRKLFTTQQNFREVEKLMSTSTNATTDHVARTINPKKRDKITPRNKTPKLATILQGGAKESRKRDFEEMAANNSNEKKTNLEEEESQESEGGLIEQETSPALDDSTKSKNKNVRVVNEEEDASLAGGRKQKRKTSKENTEQKRDSKERKKEPYNRQKLSKEVESEEEAEQETREITEDESSTENETDFETDSDSEDNIDKQEEKVASALLHPLKVFLCAALFLNVAYFVPGFISRISAASTKSPQTSSQRRI